MRFKIIISNFFIIFSCVLIVGVLIWPSVEEKFSIKSPRFLLELVGNSVFGIHYEGKSETGDFYKLKAKKVKDLGDEKYHFFSPDLIVTAINSKQYFVKSDEMIFHKKENIAYLFRNVDFKNSEGLQIKTESATVFVDKNYVEGNETVECIRQNSRITAIGFCLNGHDGNIAFKSNAQIQIIK